MTGRKARRCFFHARVTCPEGVAVGAYNRAGDSVRL